MCDVLRQMAWFLQQMNGKDEKGRGTINGHNAVCRFDLNKLTVERHFWRPSGKAEHNNGCGTHGGKMKHARQSHDIWGRQILFPAKGAGLKICPVFVMKKSWEGSEHPCIVSSLYGGHWPYRNTNSGNTATMS